MLSISTEFKIFIIGIIFLIWLNICVLIPFLRLIGNIFLISYSQKSDSSFYECCFKYKIQDSNLSILSLQLPNNVLQLGHNNALTFPVI